MEEYRKKQLTDTVQLYFDRNGLEENANFSFDVLGHGFLSIKIITQKPLWSGYLRFVESLVFTLMPTGIPYEIVNVTETLQPETKESDQDSVSIDTGVKDKVTTDSKYKRKEKNK